MCVCVGMHGDVCVCDIVTSDRWEDDFTDG